MAAHASASRAGVAIIHEINENRRDPIHHLGYDSLSLHSARGL
jgi:hypothetical protein